MQVEEFSAPCGDPSDLHDLPCCKGRTCKRLQAAPLQCQHALEVHEAAQIANWQNVLRPPASMRQGARAFGWDSPLTGVPRQQQMGALHLPARMMPDTASLAGLFPDEDKRRMWATSAAALLDHAGAGAAADVAVHSMTHSLGLDADLENAMQWLNTDGLDDVDKVRAGMPAASTSQQHAALAQSCGFAQKLFPGLTQAHLFGSIAHLDCRFLTGRQSRCHEIRRLTWPTV